MSFFNPYEITGNKTADRILSGLGNMFTGGALERNKLAQNASQANQERLAALANVASGANIPAFAREEYSPEQLQAMQSRALMNLSPEFLQSQLSALTPQGQMESRMNMARIADLQNQGINRNASTDINRQQLSLQKDKIASQTALNEAKAQRMAQQQQMMQNFNQSMVDGGQGGNMGALTSLALMSSDPAKAAEAVAGIQKMEFDKQNILFKRQSEAAKPSVEALNKMRPAIATVNAFRDAAEGISSLRTGFMAGRLPNMSDEAQYLESTAPQMALVLRTLLELPASGFSDADREFLVNIAGDSKKNKSVLIKNADRIKGLMDDALNYNNARLEYIQETGSDLGFEQFYNQVQPQQGGAQQDGVQRLQYDPATGSFTPKKKDEGGMNSSQLEEFIKQKEGFRKDAYDDVAGIPTIGYGHKITGTETTNDPEELFQQDLATATGAVDRLVKVPLNESQKTALASLVYNIGQGAFADSTLLKQLNSGDYNAAAKEFLKWNKAKNPETGKREEVQGLRNRRLAEYKLFKGVA